MTDHAAEILTNCPTCGSRVRVVSSDEGTSHYEPSGSDAQLRKAAQEVLAADGAIARQEVGSDRRWDAALAALDAALDRAALVVREEEAR